MAFAAGPQWSHGHGQSWTTTWTVDKVVDAPDSCIAFAAYMEQTLGVGFPTKGDLIILRKRINEFFKYYPWADYRTLCRLVQHHKTKTRRRFARVYTVIDSFRDVMMHDALPELANGADDLIRSQISRILEFETDERWRARLMLCTDAGSRRDALAAYRSRKHAA